MTPADTDFSFDRDIAPYASRFFGEVSADPGLTEQARARVQGTLLGGVQDIQKQRLELQKEKDDADYRRLRYAEGLGSLEESRLRRKRIEESAGQVTGAAALAKSIVDSNDDPMTKAQRLAAAELENAGISATNPDVGQVFNIAKSAIPLGPKPLVSNAQRISLALKGVPAEIIASGDPDLIAAAAEKHAAFEEGMQAERQRLTAQSKEAEEARDKLLDADFKFAQDEATKEPTGWLEDDSTMKAALLVDVYGTPEEKKQFELLKDADSDQGRVELARNIQMRQLREKLRGTQGRVSRASSITGL